MVKGESPKGLLKPEVADYIFIPKIHRFIFRKNNSKINEKDVQKFLQEQLSLEDRTTLCEIQKDDSVIDEIYDADTIYKISFSVTYSNNDNLGAAYELVDSDLKGGNARKATFMFESDNPNGLDIKNSQIMKGGLELARANGQVSSATIKEKRQNKRKTISNRDKSKVFSEKYLDDGKPWYYQLATMVLKHFNHDN